MTVPAARPAVWMLLGAFAFATMGAAASGLGPRCDWLLIALVRALFMLISTVAAARVAGIRLVLWKPGSLWLRSLAGSFSLVCNFYALTRLPVADVLTLSNAYPLWIILLSAFLLRRPPSLGESLGVGCGLLGVVVMQNPRLGGDHFAALAALVGSVATALAMIGLHRLKGVSTWAVMAHFAGVATALTAGWLALRGRTVTYDAPDSITLVLLLGMGLTGTVGQFFLTKAYAAGVPTKVSVIALTQVVFAMAYDTLVWGRVLTPMTVAGIGLVLAPTAWLSGRSGKETAAEIEPIAAAAAPVPDADEIQT